MLGAVHRYACVLLLPALVSSALASSASAQVPFPVDRNARLEELGDTFTVTGRVRVPRRITIEAMRAIIIRGEGEGATLEVSANLNLRAATGGQIEFRDVWIELTPECREISMANCIFKGKGGLRPSPDGPCEAKIELESVEFESSTSMTIEATNGSLLMYGCFLDGPLVLRGIPRSKTTKSGLTVAVYGSSGKVNNRVRGLLGGVTVEGLKDGTFRACDMAGPQALFADNRKLMFDGNNARAKRVEFRSTASGGFGGVEITKSDFRAEKLVLHSPPQEKTERLTFDNCFFGGPEDLDTIRNEMLEDAENSESGVVAVLKDTRAQPHGFAGLEK